MGHDHYSRYLKQHYNIIMNNMPKSLIKQMRHTIRSRRFWRMYMSQGSVNLILNVRLSQLFIYLYCDPRLYWTYNFVHIFRDIRLENILKIISHYQSNLLQISPPLTIIISNFLNRILFMVPGCFPMKGSSIFITLLQPLNLRPL